VTVSCAPRASVDVMLPIMSAGFSPGLAALALGDIGLESGTERS
jgi:hypothetical protein